MTERQPPPSLKDFDARLKAARKKQMEESGGARPSLGPRLAGLAMAFRIGIELVSALIVGVGIGWLLDRWLGTGPWFLILFFFFGAGAGILNVYRAVSRMGANAPGKPPGTGGENGPDESRHDGGNQ